MSTSLESQPSWSMEIGFSFFFPGGKFPGKRGKWFLSVTYTFQLRPAKRCLYLCVNLLLVHLPFWKALVGVVSITAFGESTRLLGSWNELEISRRAQSNPLQDLREGRDARSILNLRQQFQTANSPSSSSFPSTCVWIWRDSQSGWALDDAANTL